DHGEKVELWWARTPSGSGVPAWRVGRWRAAVEGPRHLVDGGPPQAPRVLGPSRRPAQSACRSRRRLGRRAARAAARAHRLAVSPRPAGIAGALCARRSCGPFCGWLGRSVDESERGSGSNLEMIPTISELARMLENARVATRLPA